MSQILFQIWDKLGLDDFEFDVTLLQTREAKVFASVVVLVAVAYCVVETCRFLWKIRCIGKRVDRFPGPPAKFFTGNLLDHPGANDTGMKWFLEAARKHKTCSRMWFGPFRPCLVTYHPSTVKEVLKTSEPKPMSQGGGYKILVPWLGYGLLTSRGNLWARNRRLLTPGFHFDVLKPYVHVYNHGGDKLVEIIDERRHSGSVEVSGPVSLATLHTVLKCAFSYEDDVIEVGESHPYVKAVTKLATYTVKRMFNPFYYQDIIYNRTTDANIYYKNVKYVHDVADDVIRKRRKTLARGGEMKKRYLDFLDILLSARDTDGRGLTDREIRQEVDTFLFEGHDTTASAISWTLFSLAGHPDIQERARQEVNHVLQDKPEEEFEWEDVNKLPYLTQCLKEAMRLHSPVPFIGRELSQELTLEGVTLLPGTFIDINICTLHHNPHVWGENHQEYIPDRFSPENSRLMDPHAFIPFSAGPRNCIGQNFAMGEMKVIIAKVLHKFRITVDRSHRIEKIPELVMRAKHGIKLNFTPV